MTGFFIAFPAKLAILYVQHFIRLHAIDPSSGCGPRVGKSFEASSLPWHGCEPHAPLPGIRRTRCGRDAPLSSADDGRGCSGVPLSFTLATRGSTVARYIDHVMRGLARRAAEVPTQFQLLVGL